MWSLTWFLLGDKGTHPPPQVGLVVSGLAGFGLHTDGLQRDGEVKLRDNLK